MKSISEVRKCPSCGGKIFPFQGVWSRGTWYHKNCEKVPRKSKVEPRGTQNKLDKFVR